MNKYATKEQAEEWVKEYMSQKGYLPLSFNSYTRRETFLNPQNSNKYISIPALYSRLKVVPMKGKPEEVFIIPSSKEDFFALLKILDK